MRKRKNGWSSEELNILSQEDLTDYEKVKLLPNRTDGAVRICRRRLGFKSKNIVFHRKFSSAGYTFIRNTKNANYDRNCRVVAEGMLGRKLKKDEVVHHINGDKGDDRPENLYVCSSRKEHNQIHYQTMEIVKKLMDNGKLVFKNGKYVLL